jgi:hypothetical protein
LEQEAVCLIVRLAFHLSPAEGFHHDLFQIVNAVRLRLFHPTLQMVWWDNLLVFGDA